jgi:hypothetical protein
MSFGDQPINQEANDMVLEDANFSSEHSQKDDNLVPEKPKQSLFGRVIQPAVVSGIQMVTFGENSNIKVENPTFARKVFKSSHNYWDKDDEESAP